MQQFTKMNEGLRYNENKPKWSLVFFVSLLFLSCSKDYNQRVEIEVINFQTTPSIKIDYKISNCLDCEYEINDMMFRLSVRDSKNNYLIEDRAGSFRGLIGCTYRCQSYFGIYLSATP